MAPSTRWTVVSYGRNLEPVPVALAVLDLRLADGQGLQNVGDLDVQPRDVEVRADVPQRTPHVARHEVEDAARLRCEPTNPPLRIEDEDRNVDRRQKTLQIVVCAD